MAVRQSGIVSILILCSCIISSRALPGTEDVPPSYKIDDRLARDCKHLFSGSVGETSGDHDDLSWNLGLHATNDYDFRTIYERLSIQEGDFFGEKGTLNATGAPGHDIQFYVRNVSRTAYKGVFLVDVSFNLLGESGRLSKNVMGVPKSKPQRKLASNFKGLFANKTGLFCASFCAGKPPSVPKGSNHLRHSYAPAEFVFMSTHPHSENATRAAFVKWDCDVHIELQYPKSRTIATPIVAGVINSARPSTDASFFHPIHIFGISQAQYEYTLSVINQAKNWGHAAKADVAEGNKLKAWFMSPPFCPGQGSKFTSQVFIHTLSAVFNSTCDSSDGNHCSPFWNYGSVDSPVTMRMSNPRCTDGPNWRISAEFVFRLSSKFGYEGTEARHNFPRLNPLTEFLLVAEGYWSNSAGQLVMVAYYLGMDGTPVDTKIQITLQLPTVRTIHHRYDVVGHIRSMREASDPLYFKTFSLLGGFVEITNSKAKSGIQYSSWTTDTTAE